MRRFSIAHPWILSFYSKELYQDVGRHWTGTGFLYLFLMLAVAWLPEVIKLHITAGGEMQRQAPTLVKDIPKITITNGKVDTDPPGRHEIKDPETGKTMAIIDASIESLNLEELPEDVFVLTRSHLVIKQKDRRQTRVQDLAGVQEFSMDRNDAERWLRVMGQWMAPVLFPFMLIASFFYRLCQALLYSLFGTAFRGSSGSSLDYNAILRLTCVAVTPAVFVDVLVKLSQIKIPMWWLFCFLIAMYYLWFGIRACLEVPAAHAPSAQAPQPPPPIAG